MSIFGSILIGMIVLGACIAAFFSGRPQGMEDRDIEKARQRYEEKCRELLLEREAKDID